MTHITLTLDQFASLSQASGRVVFCDPQGRAFVEVERVEEDPHRLQARTIPELIEELSEDDLNEDSLKAILNDYQPVGTLSGVLQRISTSADTATP